MRISVVAVVLVVLLSSCAKRPVGVLEEAEAHLRGGQWSSVVERCNLILAEDPDNPMALSLRGRAYLAMGKYEKSLADFDRILVVDPQDFDALYRRSMAHKELGDEERATEDLMQARALDPLRNSAYAYAPSNFIEKPVAGAAAALSTDSEDGDNVTEASQAPDEALTQGEREKRADLDRELDQDFYDREAQTEAVATEKALLKDSLPSSARSQIRSGQLNEDFVRGAVRSHRDIMDQEQRGATSQPRLTGSIPPVPGLSIDDLLGPDPKSEGDTKSEDESDESPRFAPPISTALPPGYVGPQSRVGIGSTSDFGGMRTPRLDTSIRGRARSQNFPGVAAPGVSKPGAPSGSIASPYQLHANPILKRQPNTNPTLSTSLPQGTGLPAASGIGPPRLGAPSVGRRLPSMLPRNTAPDLPDRP
jgi:Flp pilus assembly protein TadD